ncbi:MAG: hypothetical protein OXQ28_05515 [Acidobacteriota bacterium]|nr:hypothetical protein [Acidobacteriota bacterium]
MPDTLSMAVDETWRDAVAGIPLEAGTTYVIEFVSPIHGAVMEAFDSTDAGAHAADAAGHPHFSGTRDRPADYREFTPATGSRWWVRSLNGGGRLLATEVE